MTHAPNSPADQVRATQRYRHGWVPVNEPAGQQPAPKAKPMKPAAPDRAKRIADRKAQQAADRVKALRSKLQASQSRAGARGVLSGQKIEDLQALAAELKVSPDGDKATLVERLVSHVHPSHLQAAAANPDEPYGNVEYADPGYQPDGKKRYPLDTEVHCRAAWSRIHMPRNAAKYTPEQLKEIMGRIRAALQKYGVQIAAAASIPGVELARPGVWHLSTGKREFTVDHLRDAADFYTASGQQRIPIGFGHTDPRFDGDPAFGWLSNVRYAEDDRGPVLLGDLVEMDDWLAATAPLRWPNRSIEGFVNLEHDGRNYSLALTRLALLGATPPAMPTLRSLADMKAAVAAAAQEQGCEFIAASLPSTSDAPTSPARRPRARAVAPTTSEENTGMDPAKFLEELGISDDFSVDEVMEALAAAGFSPAADDGATSPPATPVAAAAPGTMLISASMWDETQATIKRLTDHVARQERSERDQVLAAAVAAGKFTPAQKQHFANLWDADPKGTRAVIDSLAPNTALAIAASGYATASEGDDFESEYQRILAQQGVRRG